MNKKITKKKAVEKKTTVKRAVSPSKKINVKDLNKEEVGVLKKELGSLKSKIYLLDLDIEKKEERWIKEKNKEALKLIEANIEIDDLEDEIEMRKNQSIFFLVVSVLLMGLVLFMRANS